MEESAINLAELDEDWPATYDSRYHAECGCIHGHTLELDAP